jgi:hypothetical protein
MDGQQETAEERRLRETREGVPWRRWGPYLSERQWGTVREDDSESGDAWNSFPHDHARSGRPMTMFEVARELTDRLTGVFLPDERGRRPVFGGTEIFHADPHWKDLLLFYEYFHGDNGAGIGASHQTGWTGAVARLIQLFGHVEPEHLLEGGTRPMAILYRARPAVSSARGR